MSSVLLALLAILASIVIYIIKKAIDVTKHWEKKGVPFVKPYIFFGNSPTVALQYETIGECHQRVCETFPNEPIVGFYDFMKPVLLVKDPILVEKVLIKDFPHFVNHGFDIDENRTPLESNLFNMNGKRWRAMRNKLSPIFTTGKLKNMYDQMSSVANALTRVIDSGQTKEIDIRDVLGRFAMDVIGSCAFGIEVGNLEDPDSEFRRYGKETFVFDKIQFMKFLLFTQFPNLMKKLGIGFNKKNVQDYFCNIIRETVKYRKNNNVRRNDFVDLMMQLQEKGSVEIQTKDPSDDYLQIDTNAYVTESFDITDEIMIGQAFVFLTAGFEGTAAMMSYACYEFGKNQDIQKRAREEVLEKIKLNDGKLNFDSLKEMTYLEMCLKETMRKYPPTHMLFRACTKDYTFPNGASIKAGETLVIPVLYIHREPHYYPEPMKFDPERFAPDATLVPGSYLPFGEGPRVCIAMRFAILQMKIGLAKLLSLYNMKVNPKTKEPLEFSAKAFLSTPKEPVYLDFTKI